MNSFLYIVLDAVLYLSATIITAPVGDKRPIICAFACPSGTAYDPIGGLCNCDAVTAPTTPTTPPTPIFSCGNVCPLGTSHDPAGTLCSCDLTIIASSGPEKRQAPQFICGIVCPAGFEADPSGPICDCNAPINRQMEFPIPTGRRLGPWAEEKRGRSVRRTRRARLGN
ncbi:hypothetical protein MMC17_001344 [Xylographa soralifera]|nr:hypothetical protein [Xylographa soralifera]